MHYSRIAALILGVWLGASLLMMFFAAQSFERASALEANPPKELSKAMEGMDPKMSKALLRHLAGDENRLLFDVWETAQLAIGLALTLVLFFGVNSRLMSGFSLGMLLLVAFAHVMITP